MLDFGISELGVIGVVALVVIGPQRLPRVARTIGALLGKAQRYVNEVKAEVNRSIELEELKKMKQGMQDAVQDVETSVRASAQDFDEAWRDATHAYETPPYAHATSGGDTTFAAAYSSPRKNFRLKRSAVPQWYKARSAQRRHVQSGAARVARFRPRVR